MPLYVYNRRDPAPKRNLYREQTIPPWRTIWSRSRLILTDPTPKKIMCGTWEEEKKPERGSLTLGLPSRSWPQSSPPQQRQQQQLSPFFALSASPQVKRAFFFPLDPAAVWRMRVFQRRRRRPKFQKGGWRRKGKKPYLVYCTLVVVGSSPPSSAATDASNLPCEKKNGIRSNKWQKSTCILEKSMKILLSCYALLCHLYTAKELGLDWQFNVSFYFFLRSVKIFCFVQHSITCWVFCTTDTFSWI